MRVLRVVELAVPVVPDAASIIPASWSPAGQVKEAEWNAEIVLAVDAGEVNDIVARCIRGRERVEGRSR